MSYGFGELASRDQSSSDFDPLTASDAELDAYMRSQGYYDTDTMLAECGGCMAQDRMHRAYFAGNATEADLMGLYRAQAEGALWGLGGYGVGWGLRGVRFIGGRMAGPLGRFLGPKGPAFGTSFYRGAGRSGILNHGPVRIGWSYYQRTGRLNFSLRIGKWHSDRYFNPISIKPPPYP